MSLSVTSNPQLLDSLKWDRFVREHPDGNIFQTREMFQFYGRTLNHNPVLVACFDNDEIKGLLVGVIIKESVGLLSSFTKRFIVIGGPLILNNDPLILDEILKNLNLIVKKQAIYSQIRNIWDRLLDFVTFQNNGFDFDEHLNILINLEKDTEMLWNELDSKARNKIRLAERNGLTSRFLKPGEHLETTYGLLCEVYKQARLPLPDFNFFLVAQQTLMQNDYLRILGVFKETELIAVRFLLCYHKRVYDWYAGSKRSMQHLKANDLSPWAAMKGCKELGYKIFDWGGAGKPGKPYGVREFKKKYGGTSLNFGRFERVNNRVLMGIGRIGLKLYRKFYK